MPSTAFSLSSALGSMYEVSLEFIFEGRTYNRALVALEEELIVILGCFDGAGRAHALAGVLRVLNGAVAAGHAFELS